MISRQSNNAEVAIDYYLGVSMKDELFRDLEASVREGGAILRGERLPSRTSRSITRISRAFAIRSTCRRQILPRS